jgi:glyoxylase I family protein
MINGVFHTGIIVSDIDLLVPFLCDVFEMEVTARLDTQTGPEVPMIMGLPDAQVNIVMLEKAGHTLELLQIVQPKPEPIYPETPFGKVGHAHLAFEVDDIQAAYDRMKEKGVTILTPIQDIGVMKFFHVRAPDNQWFEVVEPRK